MIKAQVHTAKNDFISLASLDVWNGHGCTNGQGSLINYVGKYFIPFHGRHKILSYSHEKIVLRKDNESMFGFKGNSYGIVDHFDLLTHFPK